METVPQWTSGWDGEQTWFTKLEEAEKVVEGVAKASEGKAKDLSVYGRKLRVPWQIDDQVARFTFSELCEKVRTACCGAYLLTRLLSLSCPLFMSYRATQALGPADYLSITSTYPTIVITHIPQLKLNAKNEARRFITFLDAACRSRSSSNTDQWWY